MTYAVFDYEEIGKRLQNRWLPVEKGAVKADEVIEEQRCHKQYIQYGVSVTCPSVCMKKSGTNCVDFGGKPTT